MKLTFFITGTDTEIGKTRCSVYLINAFRQLGLTVAGMKPIAAGGYWENGELKNEDVEHIIAASGLKIPPCYVNPYLFELAIAPHLAAAQLGQVIELEKIIAAYQHIATTADLIVIEGVGGWRVPINSTQTMSAIVQATRAQVIVVVGLRLGCINHALLTIEAILRDQCVIAGWIANTLDPHFASTEVIETLSQRITAPLLAVIPFIPSPHHHFSIQVDRLLKV